MFQPLAARVHSAVVQSTPSAQHPHWSGLANPLIKYCIVLRVNNQCQGPITLSESENENTTVKLLLKNHGGALRFQVHFNVVIVIFWWVNMYSNTVGILIWTQFVIDQH